MYQFPDFKILTWTLTINYKKSLMSSHNRRNLWWIVQFVKYMLTFVICNAEVYSNFTPILVTRQHQTVWPNIYHIHPQVQVGGQYGNCLLLSTLNMQIYIWTACMRSPKYILYFCWFTAMHCNRVSLNSKCFRST